MTETTHTHVAVDNGEPCYEILPGVGMSIRVAGEPVMCYWHADCRAKARCFWRHFHGCDQRGRPDTDSGQRNLSL